MASARKNLSLSNSVPIKVLQVRSPKEWKAEMEHVRLRLMEREKETRALHQRIRQLTDHTSKLEEEALMGAKEGEGMEIHEPQYVTDACCKYWRPIVTTPCSHSLPNTVTRLQPKASDFGTHVIVLKSKGLQMRLPPGSILLV